MCEPTTIALAGLALSATTAGAGLYGQHQQGKAQAQANQTQYEGQMTAYRGNLANIEVTRGQLQADATDKVNANNAASRAAQATARTSAGESGISGVSVDALLRDLAGEAGFDNTSVEENYLRQSAALNVQRENVFNNTASGINSLKTPAAPDYVGAGLRVAQDGLNIYSQHKKNTRPGGP